MRNIWKYIDNTRKNSNVNVKQDPDIQSLLDISVLFAELVGRLRADQHPPKGRVPKKVSFIT